MYMNQNQGSGYGAGCGNPGGVNQYSYDWAQGQGQDYSRWGFPYRPPNMYGYPHQSFPPWGPGLNTPWGVHMPGPAGQWNARGTGMGVSGLSGVRGMTGAPGLPRAMGMSGMGQRSSLATCEHTGGVEMNGQGQGQDQEESNQSVRKERNVKFSDNTVSITIPSGKESEEEGKREEEKETGANTADGGGNTTPSPSNTGTTGGKVGENPTTTKNPHANTQASLANTSFASQQGLTDTEAGKGGPNRPTETSIDTRHDNTESVSLPPSQQTHDSLADNATQVASSSQSETNNSGDRQIEEEEQSGLDQSGFSQPTPLPTEYSVREEGGGKGKGRDSLARSGTARLSLSGKGEGLKSFQSKLVVMRAEGKSVGGDKLGKAHKQEGLRKTRSQSGKK